MTTERNHDEQPKEQPFVRAEGTPCLHELHFGAGMSNEMTKEKREAPREERGSGIWSNFCILGVKTELAENSEFSFRLMEAVEIDFSIFV